MVIRTEKVGAWISLLIIGVSFLSTSQASPVRTSHKVCITLDSESTTEFRQELERLEDQYGLVPVFVLPPHCVIGYSGASMITAMKADGRTNVHNTLLSSPTEMIPQAPETETDKMLHAWRAFFRSNDSIQLYSEQREGIPSVPPPDDDIILTDTDYRLDTWEKLTSEYLIGEVAVGIFLMESEGSIENWSNGPPNRPDSVWEKIILGLTWVHEQAMGRGVNVEFWFDGGGFHEAVPTGYEPITMSSKDDNLWIEDAMEHLDFTGLYDYLNAMRSNLATDWACAVFVVDDWNDEDNRFADGKFAYAKNWIQWSLTGAYELKHGGPCMVMTYDNGDWSYNQMHSIFSHEFYHLFGCPDEYPNGFTCQEPQWEPWILDCECEYGYLFYQNYNCAACNDQPNPCIMNDGWLGSGMCEWTYRHLGWYDSDGDGVSDPIDPNTGVQMYIGYVEPGDVITIWTLDADFVKRINVTEANSASWNGVLNIIWDMTNWNGQPVAVQPYIIEGNGVKQPEAGQITTDRTPISFVEPWIEEQTVVCSLATDWAYVRLEILDSGGERVLYPVRDELFSGQERIEGDLSSLPYGNYTARLFGWLPNGSLSETYDYQIPSEEALVAVSNLDYIHGYYEPKIVIDWVDSNGTEDGFAVERKPAASGSWEPLDSVAPTEYWTKYEDYGFLGSETYTYRVRPFTYSGQNGPWSEELVVKAKPRPPENVTCEVQPGIMCCPPRMSNRVVVRWDPPSNQLHPIDHYTVFRWEAAWMGKRFGPIYDTVIEICPNVSGYDYEFYVYSFDSAGDSSIVQNYCWARPGPENACPDLAERPQITGELLPTQPQLHQNYPNPFNPSTMIAFELPHDQEVEVTVVDILGRTVKTICHEHLRAGRHEIPWNGTDQNGNRVSSGVYFYILKTESSLLSQQMVLLK